MRRISVAVAAFLTVFGTAAAGQQTTGQNAGGFAQQAAVANQTDFQLRNSRTISRQSAQRQFGQAMIDDHRSALDHLSGTGGVTWPVEIDAKHRQLEQELSTLMGRAFDKRFIDAMIEDDVLMASLLRQQAGTAPTSRPAPITPPARAPSVAPRPASARRAARSRRASAWARSARPAPQALHRPGRRRSCGPWSATSPRRRGSRRRCDRPKTRELRTLEQRGCSLPVPQSLRPSFSIPIPPVARSLLSVSPVGSLQVSLPRARHGVAVQGLEVLR